MVYAIERAAAKPQSVVHIKHTTNSYRLCGIDNFNRLNEGSLKQSSVLLFSAIALLLNITSPNWQLIVDATESGRIVYDQWR